MAWSSLGCGSWDGSTALTCFGLRSPVHGVGVNTGMTLDVPIAWLAACVLHCPHHLNILSSLGDSSQGLARGNSPVSAEGTGNTCWAQEWREAGSQNPTPKGHRVNSSSWPPLTPH